MAGEGVGKPTPKTFVSREKMLGRLVFITVVCIAVVRLVYAVVRDQSLVDALGQSLIALLIASVVVFILRQTENNRQHDKRE
jgi:uncharacterized membrane protein